MLTETKNIVSDIPRKRTKNLILKCLEVKAARAEDFDGSAVKGKFRSKKSKPKNKIMNIFKNIQFLYI